MKAFLLHTVRPGLNTFEGILKAHYPDLEVRNLMDDFWIRETGKHHHFTTECMVHLLQICISMELGGADIIICTCSSLTPYFDEIRKYIRIPIVAIDATMAEKSLEYGPKILILSTAATAIASAREQIEAEAEKRKLKCDIHPLLCDDAGQIMRSGGDMAEHDRIILEKAKQIQGYDVIVFTQLSTAHLAKRVQEICNIPTITTPGLCIEDLKNYKGLENPA